MLRITSTLIFLITAFLASAQVIKPASWVVSTSTDDVDREESFEIYFDVTIDPDWYLYSSDFDPDCGPMVTSFTFNTDESF